MLELHPSKWRGKFITTRKDSRGARYTAMSGSRAMLFVPIKVEPNSSYRLYAEMRRDSGDGNAFFNIFANKNFDFPQVPIQCSNSDWATYTLILKTNEFPANLPLVLRLWRQKGGKGSILVRKISMERVENDLDEKPQLITSSPSHVAQETPVSLIPPPEPGSEAARRELIRQEIIKRREKRAMARKLGAPKKKRDRREKRKRVNIERNSSTYPYRKSSVFAIVESGYDAIQINDAFAATNIGVEVFNTESGFSLDMTINKHDPSWIHIFLSYSKNDKSITADNMITIRKMFPNAIITSSAPSSNRLDSRVAELFKLSDIRFIEDETTRAFYNSYGIQTELWGINDKNETLAKLIKDLCLRVGVPEVITPKMPKERIVGEFTRVLCILPNIPNSSISGNLNIDNLEIFTIPFTCCADIQSKVFKYEPNWIHIHIPGENNDIPWKDAFLDLKRKMSTSIITAWHNSKNEGIIPFTISMADIVDHMITNNKNLVVRFEREGVKNTVFCERDFDILDLETFKQNLLFLSTTMKKSREEFLTDRNNERVELSIFIGTYNRLEHLKKAISSAIVASGNKKIEIIVNDAGSTDGTIGWLNRLSSENTKIVNIFSGKRTSFTQAFNESLRIAKGKFICWLSDDIVAKDKSLERMCKIMNDAEPMDLGAFTINGPRDRIFKIRVSEGFLCPTVCCAYTEALRRMNGLNMDYPFYSQDTEINHRMMRMGGRILEGRKSMLEHNCQSDELRIDNGIKHATSLGGEKLVVVRINNFLRKPMPYPMILIIAKDSPPSQQILSNIDYFRSHYSNAHFFLSMPKGNISLGIKYSFVHMVPIPLEQEYNKFDIIIELNLEGRKLIHPKRFLDNQFLNKVI
jgi:glycosyltransferase involved in cell wall biosynthesis